jgi:uncharacterized protein (UPF0276 family)
VNQRNRGESASAFIAGLPIGAVGEIHLAGHSEQSYDGESVIVDTHDTYVCEDVWALYGEAIDRFGPVPTLVEWDSRLPAIDELIAEARRADSIMRGSYAIAA